jgi:hypothetical protein
MRTSDTTPPGASHYAPVSTSNAGARVTPPIGVPHWPAIVGLFVAALLLAFVANQLAFAPSLLPLAVVVVVAIPLAFAIQRENPAWRRRLGMIALGTVTAAVAASTLFLVYQLATGKITAPSLLTGAAGLWAANLVTFGLWYWEIDGGGPGKRRRDGHVSTDFLFPQLQVGDGTSSHGWWPTFLDYLFVAFNASTAFSPTDTLLLSRKAKVLMMIQATISFVNVIVIAARAINTLNS